MGYFLNRTLNTDYLVAGSRNTDKSISSILPINCLLNTPCIRNIVEIRLFWLLLLVILFIPRYFNRDMDWMAALSCSLSCIKIRRRNLCIAYFSWLNSTAHPTETKIWHSIFLNTNNHLRVYQCDISDIHWWQ